MTLRRIACLWIHRGTCLDAVQLGRAQVHRDRLGEYALRLQAIDARRHHAGEDMSVAPGRRTSASTEPARQEGQKGAAIRVRRRSVMLDPSAGLHAARLTSAGRLDAIPALSPAMILQDGEAAILSTMPLSAGGQPLAKAEAEIRQIGPGHDALHIGRQLASLLLGWQPEAEGILVVVTRPEARRTRLALGLGGLLATAALLALALGWRTPAEAQDTGLAVLLSGDARTVDAPQAAELRRLQGIFAGEQVVTTGSASFGFSSQTAPAGLDSIGLYALDGARLEFLEISRGGEASGAPVVIAPREGGALFVRTGEGRVLCFAGSEEWLCSSTTLGAVALGAACGNADCEWSCLLGACRLERGDEALDLAAPVRLERASSIPVPISPAELLDWDDACGGCLQPR